MNFTKQTNSKVKVENKKCARANKQTITISTGKNGNKKKQHSGGSISNNAAVSHNKISTPNKINDSKAANLLRIMNDKGMQCFNSINSMISTDYASNLVEQHLLCGNHIPISRNLKFRFFSSLPLPPM